VPAELAGDVRKWSQIADGGMGGVRARVLAKLLEHPGALDASLPPFVPGWIRPVFRPTTRFILRQLQRKYQTRADEGAAHVMQLREALDRLRAALKQKHPYLLGRFTYADIVMATLLQGVFPVAEHYMPIGPSIREVWTEESLVDEYADLIAWRDTIYERHRHAKPN